MTVEEKVAYMKGYMEAVGEYYESEIEPIMGNDLDSTKFKGKVKRVKMKCNNCGCIDYLLKCPKCGYAMFKYRNQLR